MCCEKCNPALIESLKHPAVVTTATCTCLQVWMSISDPPWCPVHGQRRMVRSIC